MLAIIRRKKLFAGKVFTDEEGENMEGSGGMEMPIELDLDEEEDDELEEALNGYLLELSIQELYN